MFDTPNEASSIYIYIPKDNFEIIAQLRGLK